MRTDTSTACGILTSTFKQNRSKAIDMQFYWLWHRAAQGQFRIYWDRGKTNLADYFSKHHLDSHHRKVQPIYVSTKNSPSSLQGCIELLNRRAQPVYARHTATAFKIHKQLSTVDRHSHNINVVTVNNSNSLLPPL